MPPTLSPGRVWGGAQWRGTSFSSVPEHLGCCGVGSGGGDAPPHPRPDPTQAGQVLGGVGSRKEGLLPEARRRVLRQPGRAVFCLQGPLLLSSPQPVPAGLPPPSLSSGGSPAPRAGEGVGRRRWARLGGVHPALHERGLALPASWAQARASRSWHSCWHARQTPTATCSHPPTSAGARRALPASRASRRPLPATALPPPHHLLPVPAPRRPFTSGQPCAWPPGPPLPSNLGARAVGPPGGPWDSCTLCREKRGGPGGRQTDRQTG